MQILLYSFSHTAQQNSKGKINEVLIGLLEVKKQARKK